MSVGCGFACSSSCSFCGACRASSLPLGSLYSLLASASSVSFLSFLLSQAKWTPMSLHLASCACVRGSGPSSRPLCPLHLHHPCAECSVSCAFPSSVGFCGFCGLCGLTPFLLSVLHCLAALSLVDQGLIIAYLDSFQGFRRAPIVFAPLEPTHFGSLRILMIL